MTDEITPVMLRRCEDGRICRYPRDDRRAVPVNLIIGVQIMACAFALGLGTVLGWSIHP